jgi:hypothetical protein
MSEHLTAKTETELPGAARARHTLLLDDDRARLPNECLRQATRRAGTIMYGITSPFSNPAGRCCCRVPMAAKSTSTTRMGARCPGPRRSGITRSISGMPS